MKTKTAVAAALAALAFPAGALATGDHASRGDDQRCNKSEDARHTGHAHQAKRGDHRGGHHKGHQGRQHRPGFVVKGSTAATALPVTDGKLTGPLTLDPTAANNHARKFLAFSKEDLRGTKTATFGETGDEVKVRYKGLSSTDALQPTDVVKVIGKVKRTRNADGTKTYGPLDIRFITVKRPS